MFQMINVVWYLKRCKMCLLDVHSFFVIIRQFITKQNWNESNEQTAACNITSCIKGKLGLLQPKLSISAQIFFMRVVVGVHYYF